MLDPPLKLYDSICDKPGLPVSKLFLKILYFCCISGNIEICVGDSINSPIIIRNTYILYDPSYRLNNNQKNILYLCDSNLKNNFSALWFRANSSSSSGDLPGKPRSIQLQAQSSFSLLESQIVSLSSDVQMMTTFLDFVHRVVPQNKSLVNASDFLLLKIFLSFVPKFRSTLGICNGQTSLERFMDNARSSRTST